MKAKIILITSGRGPSECCWVVAQVLKLFIADLKTVDIAYEVLYRERGLENGTLQSATVQLRGNHLDSFLAAWLGTIQWIGKSAFRTSHKRKNWFIGIYAMNETKETKLMERDVKFQAIRSSGPGGQHVNKTNSAVRATHMKTGISVLVMDSRSQHQNRKIAIRRLQEKVIQRNKERLKKTNQNQWKNHLRLERGNPVKVFIGNDFKRCRIDKKYKSKRLKLKRKLKNENWED